MNVKFRLNDEDCTVDGPPMRPVLDVLRDDFQLTGTKDVCREGFCGACTVLLDDRPAVACLTPIGSVDGRNVHTIESLARNGRPSPLQQALEDIDAVQCGMCFPGMVMTLTHVLRHDPAPTAQALRQALSGNLCRCTGYERIIEAALSLGRQGRPA